MATKAYVLIDCETGKVTDVAKALMKMPEILAADVVTGPHDIIAAIQGEGTEAIAQTILTKIPDVPGVTDTTTCLVLSLKEGEKVQKWPSI